MYLSDLYKEIDRLCTTDDTSFPLADKARLVNFWYYRGLVAILMSNRSWAFDDRNHTTLPILETTTVAGQGRYDLPTDFLQVRRVELGDRPLTEMETENASFGLQDVDNVGTPMWYDIRGDSIYLYPRPSSGGDTLRLYITREIMEISETTDPTSYKISVPVPFQQLIPYGVASDYWAAIDDTRANNFLVRAENIISMLKRFTKTQVKPGYARLSSHVNERNFL